MRAILPGRPQSKRQALCTAHWDGLCLVAYVSGNTAIILKDPQTIIQTISIDHVENLSAITIDELSGRIALSDGARILIFDAVGRDENDLRWTQLHDISVPDDGVGHSISWGSSEELLIGGTKLWLYHIPYSEPPRLIWQRTVANEIKIAYFSHDAELIASCGQHDRLVKIWRRLSFELDSTRFDVTYLPHPAAVVDLHWRHPWHKEQSLDNLLYTTCLDNKVRVWAYSDPHSLSIMQLIATIDIHASIEPRRRSVGSMSRKRYAFILDSRDFARVTEKAILQSNNQQVDHALEHLIEIANRSPEFCVVFDGLGHMSVWGLENAGCKSRLPTVVFNVALVDAVDIQLDFQHGQDDEYTRIWAFGGGASPASLSVLVHSFTGQIDWYESPIVHFFDTSSRNDRVKLLSSWSGHDLAIDHIARGVSGNKILSWTDEGQAILWSQSSTGALRRRCELNIQSEVVGVILLDVLGHLLVLNSDAMSLWDVRHSHGVKVTQCPIDAGSIPTSMHYTESDIKSTGRTYFTVVFTNGEQQLWQLYLSKDQSQKLIVNRATTQLSRLSTTKQRLGNDQQVSSCDFTPRTRNQLVQHNKKEIYVSNDGKIQSVGFYLGSSPAMMQGDSISILETRIKNPALVRVSESGKVVLVAEDRKSLTIWNLDQGVCEWYYSLTGTEEIQKLAWTTTLKGNHFLFVGFSYHALVIGQFRYPCNSPNLSAWYITQNISLRDFTTIHIGDVCWLSSGDLAMGAGNQIFVLENHITERDSPILRRSQRIIGNKPATAVLDMANSTLPIFHPDFLEALFVEDGLNHAEMILREFYEKLKYFSDGDELPSDLSFSAKQLQFASYDHNEIDNTQVNGDTDHSLWSLEGVESAFVEYIENAFIWQMGPKKQKRIANVFTNLIKVGRYCNSLDENGLRYLYDFYNTPDDQDLPWRAHVFASRSKSHEALLDLISRYYDGKLTWKIARRAGIFIWLKDITALQTQFEIVARNEYTKHEDRNPVDCSLYYLALNKKAVLQGLWRMTFGVREKENTIKLLANNFNEPRWKATALKNAYALLSKRRFEYGAAFFLLGSSLKDAVNICVNQLKDIQLAIAITRVWDKDLDQSKQVLQDLLQRHVLSMAIDSEEGRWIAAWAYTMLEQPAKALQSLTRSLHQVIETNPEEYESPLKSMSFRTNDPHLQIFYTQLRSTLVKQNKWTSTILTPQEEWRFVLRCARWWVRAGMDYLAVKLLREWEFIPYQEPRDTIAPTTLVSPIEDKNAFEIKDEGKVKEVIETKKKPPPTQFIEPSADSLLDSFGF